MITRDGSLRRGAGQASRPGTDGKPQKHGLHSGRTPAPREADAWPTLSSAEAIAAGNPRLALMGQALVWLMRFGDVTLGLFYPVDRRLRRSRAVTVTHVQATTGLADLTQILSGREERAGFLDPFAPRRLGPGGLNVADLAHLGDSDAAAYVDGFLAPIGMRNQSTLLLRSRGRVVAAVDLLGRSRDPAAVAGWLGFLRSSHAFLEQAYACSLEFPVAPSQEGNPPAAKLTKRELAVARLVAEGARNSEVAGSLAIAEATVKTHLVRIYEKLGIATRTQLAVLLQGAAPGSGDDGDEPGDDRDDPADRVSNAT